MNAQEIIQHIAQAEKKTPVKLYIKETEPIDYGPATVFGVGEKIDDLQPFNADEFARALFSKEEE